MSGYDYWKNTIVWDADSVREACENSDIDDDAAANIIAAVWNDCNLWEVTREAARRAGFECDIDM